jgi:hypothetical protein
VKVQSGKELAKQIESKAGHCFGSTAAITFTQSPELGLPFHPNTRVEQTQGRIATPLDETRRIGSLKTRADQKICLIESSVKGANAHYSSAQWPIVSSTK